MKNPTMLYRCPGPEVFEGVQCETTVVDGDDTKAMKAARADGWCSDWMHAKDALAEKIAMAEAEAAAAAAALAKK